MSLHFILDGYNIIKSGLIEDFEGKTLEKQRAVLIGLVERRRPHGSGNNSVTVVFDGSYEMAAAYPREQRLASGIQVVFSGGESADDKIENIVAARTNAADVVVVTNDKGIKRRLGGRGVKYMSLEDFAERVAEPKANRPGSSRDNGMEGITDDLKKEWLK